MNNNAQKIIEAAKSQFGITLMSKNAYCIVDGTNAYIQLSA